MAHRRGYDSLESRSALLLVLLVMAASTLLLVQSADAQTEPPVSGDWTVSDYTVIENRTVQLFGDLTVASGGHLVLRNVTLQVFSSTTTTHGIRVMDNGTLRLLDVDGLAGTDVDGSVVMRGQPAFGFSFIAENGSQLQMENSLISGAGSTGGTGGVIVRNSGLQLEGMTFLNGIGFSLLMEGSEDATLDRCNFNGSRNGLVLRDCENITVFGSFMASNVQAGLRLEDCNATSIVLCNISDNDFIGMWVGGGEGNRAERTWFSQNQRSVVLSSTSGFWMERCQVTSSTFEGITIAPGCRDITVLSTQVVTSRRTGVDVDGVEGLTIWDTRIEENRYYGIRLLNGSKDVFFNKTTVEDNGYDGVHIERAQDVRFERGYYQRNGYNGIFLIDVVNATLTSTGLYDNTYDGLDCDSVVDLVLEVVWTVGNGYNGLRLQAGSHEIQVNDCFSSGDTRSGLNVDSAYNVTVRSFWARQEGGFGVRVEGGSYNVSGSFDLANNTGGALRVQNCHDVRLEDSQLEQGSAGMYLVYGRNAYDIWISNSTTNGTVHLIGIANVSMVNCTFDDVTPDVDTTSRLMFLTLVDVLVLWPTASPVTGAAVNATGISGLVLARGVTNASGLTGDLAVLMETYTGDAVISENPITFFARKGNEVARNVTNVLGRSTVLIVLEDDEDPIPVAPDVDAELNVQARLDGSASSDNGQLVSWVWTFDDGVGTVVLEGRRVNWTFTVLGTFSGQLEVSDSVGHTNSTYFTIRVTDSISPQVVAGSNVTVDQGTILPVDGTSTTDNDSTLIATGTFWWRVIPEAPGPGERSFTGPINSIPFPDMGVYMVELNVSDQSGNWGLDRFWVTVNDTTAPVVDAGVDVEVGEGEEMLLEPAAVTDNDPAFDAGMDAWWHVTGPATDLTLDGLQASFVPPTMGVYQATLHVTDAAGNEGTGSRLVTALDRLPPVVEIGADSTVEVFTEVTFDAGAVTDNDPGFPEGVTYRWTITGPRMDEEHRGESIAFTVPWVGDYVITLRVTDAAGNEGNDSVRVTSVDTALPAFGPFYPTPLNISDTTDVTVTFIITDVGTGVDGARVEMRTRSPSTVAWSDWGGVTVDGGVTRIEETMVLWFPEGNSLLQLRCWDLAGNGPVVSEEHSISVNSRPVVVVLSPSDGAEYGPFDEVLLDASASSDLDGDELSYVWSSDVDGIIGGAESVRAPPLSEGTHRITLVVSDGVTGHDVLAQVTITVRPVPSTVDPDEGIPWWILAAAVLLFAGFAFVIWDHSRRRQRPPPPEEASEWVETQEDEDWAPSMHMKSGQLE